MLRLIIFNIDDLNKIGLFKNSDACMNFGACIDVFITTNNPDYSNWL
jgi:hypothetical protein